MMMKIKAEVITIIILVAVTILTGSAKASPGTSADFINMIPGARSAAMAEAYCAMGNDAEVIYYNPAGLVTMINPQLGLSHLTWWNGVTYNAIWGVHPLGQIGTLGLAVNYLNVEPFNSTNDSTAPSSRAWMGMGSIAYSKKIMRSFALGGRLNGWIQDLDNSQSISVTIDFGGQYYLLNDLLTLALTVRNLGFSTAYIDEADNVPMEVAVGAAYQLWPDDPNGLTFTSEFCQPFEDDIQTALGIEARVINMFYLRGGVKSNADAGDWLTLGLGARWKRVILDYAVTPLGELGLTHRVALKYNFGSQRRMARPKLDLTIVTKQFVYSDGEPGQEVLFIPKAEVAAGVNKWQMIVKNKNMSIIKTINGRNELPMKVVWKGNDENGVRVDVEGYYRYNMKLWDRFGYTAQKTGEILPVSITKLPKLKALPRDIFAGKISFSSNSKRKVKSWTITIVNAEGQVLKKYQGKGMIPKDFTWDGKDRENRQVALKKGYRFILRLTDEEDNEIKSVAPIVVVNAGTKARTKEDLPLPEQVPFNFQLSAAAQINGWALDIMETKTGKVIRSVESEGALPERVFWDARDENGNIVPSNKSYSYVLRLQDPIGNVWHQASAFRETEVKVLEKSDDGVTIKIEQILFDFNKAELKAEMHEKLRKTADIVREYGKNDVELYIEGHTDDVGSDKYNLELSEKRAQMVMRYLVEEEAISSLIIVMKGYGKGQPVIKSDTIEARSMNRRVEITIVLPKKK